MREIEHNMDAEQPQLQILSKLLGRRRIEADAILDLIRAVFQPDRDRSHILLMVKNTLLGNVIFKKLFFLYESEGERHGEVLMGFSPPTPMILEAIQATDSSKIFNGEVEQTLKDWGATHIIPIVMKGVPKAYFVLNMLEAPTSETEWRNMFIETVGHITYQALQNQEQIKQKIQQQRVKQELAVAETIQKQLLISNFNSFFPLDIYGKNIPYSEVGGDYYDIITTETGTFVCIADISGKGIAAALVMSNVQAYLRTFCIQYSRVSDIVLKLNEVLYNTLKGEKFVSLFLAKIDLENQLLTYINAGHNFPYFLQNESITELASTTTILGTFATISAKHHTLPLEKGGCLFLYTDGYVEQPNLEGEVIEESEILRLLCENLTESSQVLCNNLLAHYKQFSKNAEIIDDITILAVKW